MPKKILLFSRFRNEGRDSIKIFVYLLLVLLTTTNISTAQNISIYIDCDGEFIVEDPLGRKTGWNPNLSQEYDEIPNAIYDDVGIPGVMGKIFQYYTTNEVDLLLKYMSTGKSKYFFDIDIYRPEKDAANFIFKGVADENKIDKYEIHFDPDTTKPVWCTKKVNNEVFSRDLELCRELQLIKTDTAHNILKDNLDGYESYRQRGNIDSAAEALSQFIDNLNNMNTSQRTPDAVAILKVDVEMLQKQLKDNR